MKLNTVIYFIRTDPNMWYKIQQILCYYCFYANEKFDLDLSLFFSSFFNMYKHFTLYNTQIRTF